MIELQILPDRFDPWVLGLAASSTQPVFHKYYRVTLTNVEKITNVDVWLNCYDSAHLNYFIWISSRLKTKLTISIDSQRMTYTIFSR